MEQNHVGELLYFKYLPHGSLLRNRLHEFSDSRTWRIYKNITNRNKRKCWHGFGDWGFVINTAHFDNLSGSHLQSQVTWLWRWLPLSLSKRQSPTTVLFRTTFTRTITLYELLILLGSNHLQCNTAQLFSVNNRNWYPINSLERQLVILELTASAAFGKQNPKQNIILSNFYVL